MIAALPAVAPSACWLIGDLVRLSGRVAIWSAKTRHETADFRCPETRDFEIEMTLGQYGRKLTKFGRKETSIPSCVDRNFVIRDGKRSLFGIAQSSHHDDRDLCQPKHFCRFKAGVAADNVEFFVHQNRIRESKLADGVCELPDLLFRMSTRVARVGP